MATNSQETHNHNNDQKQEIVKVYLPITISIIALIISIFGSPFDEGGFFNPLKPEIRFNGRSAQTNNTNLPGKYQMDFYLVNSGKGTGLVKAKEVIFFDSNFKKIPELSKDNGPVHFEMVPNDEKVVYATANHIPTYSVICADILGPDKEKLYSIQHSSVLMSSPKQSQTVAAYGYTKETIHRKLLELTGCEA